MQSAIFQWLLDIGVTALKIVTDAVNKLTEAVLWVSEKINEFINFITGHSEDLDGWAILIGSIATAIGLVVGAIIAYNIISAIATIATTAFGVAMQILTSPITLIVLAIGALIAVIVLCIKHWETIKTVATNVLQTIGNVAKSIINLLIGGFEGLVNGFIYGINIILSGVSKIANAIGSLIGLNPINLKLNKISLPRLAKGGVLTQPTTVLAGEYAGARSNPEIVTPQNIMYDTMRRAIEDTEFHNNNGQTINLTVKVGNKKLGQVLLEDLRDMTRQTGKDIEALVGG